MTKQKDDMKLGYDLSGKKSVRGKYAKAYKEGHSVRIYNMQSLVSDEYFASIEPDVLQYYPDSKSINRTLRKLISLVPQTGKPER